jgi:hypothetical protein
METMLQKQISQDDISDVREMTVKLEDAMTSILIDNDMDLAFSALVSATINCMLGQCDTIQEVKYYRDVFIKLINTSVDSIRPL